jgi:hypothetical protein
MRADDMVRQAFEAAREKEAAAASAAAAVAAAGPAVNPIPWYYRAVPCIDVGIKQGSIVMCAANLEYNTAITFRGATGLVCVGTADYPVDLYKFTVKMALKMAEVVLIPNKHRLRTSSSLKRSPPRGGVHGGGDTDFMEGLDHLGNSGGEHEPLAGWTESSKFFYSNCWDTKTGEFVCASPECHVLQSPFMKITYSQDQGKPFFFFFECVSFFFELLSPFPLPPFFSLQAVSFQPFLRMAAITLPTFRCEFMAKTVLSITGLGRIFSVLFSSIGSFQRTGRALTRKCFIPPKESRVLQASSKCTFISLCERTLRKRPRPCFEFRIGATCIRLNQLLAWGTRRKSTVKCSNGWKLK